ncbi:hypothetical protein FNV43_RR16658 [Rhamnella rubrinervis]|uniref:N-acetyltransferase ESCO2 n=1 Tax=Rhamnella rubrinervis TaxID=2594499 RepID=A0A8K0GZ65_9ROSA|nr:hypothetical protein FNV43_RR16658 [Rhamnella rubrinervis]
MQSKISAFFKSTPSATQSPDSPPIIDGDDDELAIWERKEHQYFSTYSRRAPRPRSGENDKEASGELLKNPISDNCFSKPKSTVSGGPVTKNKKRSYAQFHLELGQSDFLLHTCSTCGIKYAPGDEEDEKAHKTFHKNYTHGIQFKGWCNERVIHMPTNEAGRIVAAFDNDPPVWRNKVGEVVKMMEIELGSGWIFHKLCKVFLFVSSQRVVGCLIAEPIQKAFRVFSTSVGGSSDVTKTKKEIARPTTLQFGDINFQREVVKRAPSQSKTELLDENLNGAIFCEKEAVPAACGIRAIWVSPANRRKHIATQLLDAVRKSFCLGYVLERSQLAFSQPTSTGKALASNYVGTGSFLVYKSNHLDSVC